MPTQANDSAAALCADMLAELHMGYHGDLRGRYHEFRNRAEALGIDPSPQIRALEDAERELYRLDELIARQLAGTRGTFGTRVRNIVRSRLCVRSIAEMASLDVDTACKSAGVKGGRTIECIRECRDAAAYAIKDR